MKKVFLFLSSIILACSCAKSTNADENPSGDDSEITFSSSILPSTRVTSDVFESGDQIYVSAYESGTSYSSQVSYTYDGSLFQSSSPIYYNADNQELSFVAIYPAISGFDSSFTFSANRDQSNSDDYESSDLLISTHEATTEACPTLSFTHVMSSLIVNISDSELSGGVLKIFAKASATIDIDSQSYASTGSVSEITAAANGDLSYKVIIAPQAISAGETIATYTVGETVYSWVANNNVEFTSGYRYTYTWDITQDDITYDGNIEGWDDEVLDDTPLSATLSLSEISATNIPDANTWIFTDQTAVSTDFAGFSEAILALLDADRQIYVEFPYLKTLPQSAIRGEVVNYGFSDTDFDALYSLSAKSATVVESGAFDACNNLSYLELPSAVTIAGSTFSCMTLKTLDLPMVTYIGNAGFGNNHELTSVSLPSITEMEGQIFCWCDQLTELTMATNEGVVLENIGTSSMSAFLNLDTENIILTIGSMNTTYIDGNTLSIGEHSHTFKEIIIVDNE